MLSKEISEGGPEIDGVPQDECPQATSVPGRSRQGACVTDVPGMLTGNDATRASAKGTSKKASRSDRALERLRAAVARVPRAKRRTVLERLSSRVRLALLGFMESHPWPSARIIKGFPEGKASVPSDPTAAAVASAIEVEVQAETCRSLPQTDGGKLSIPGGKASCLGRATARDESCTTTSPRRGLPHLPGVTRVGKHRYRAHVFFYNIRIHTACVPLAGQAAQFHEVLREVKRDVSDKAGKADQVLLSASIVQHALALSCDKHGLREEELGLVYRAEIRAKAIIDRDIWGRYSADLQSALADRQLLLAGKAAGWPSLRSAWISVMKMPVLVRESAPPGWARHAQLGQAAAAAIADAAWAAWKARHGSAGKGKVKTKAQSRDGSAWCRSSSAATPSIWVRPPSQRPRVRHDGHRESMAARAGEAVERILLASEQGRQQSAGCKRCSPWK